jgi:phosphoenolpyruvate carboxylase
VAERLRATYEGRSGQYDQVGHFIEDLQLVERSLADNRGREAGMFHVRRMLRRVRTFGFHLATLDVRQHALMHREIVGGAFGDPDWVRRPALERAERLGRALAADESPFEDLTPAGKRALWVFEAMEFCRKRFGEPAVGTYVVSMAHDIDDVLSVLLLARWAGMAEGRRQVPLDVAPLFESVEALEEAGTIIARLLADPPTGHTADRQLSGRDAHSDSNKSARSLVRAGWRRWSWRATAGV